MLIASRIAATTCSWSRGARNAWVTWWTPRFPASIGGEFVAIPALPDAGQWQAYEAARQTLLPNVSRRASE